MDQAARSMRQCSKTQRVKSLLRKVLVVVMRPIDFHSILSSSENATVFDKQRINCTATCIDLFQMLKSENQRRFNTRLTESFGEVCLSGWISPSTLLINGPSEELRIIKQAWCRRSLRSPPGFQIKEIGSIEDVTMETTPQAQFMSLTASIVDALIELNKCKIYPTMQLLVNYLKVCYHGVQFPDNEVIVARLQGLMEDGTVQQNDRGYIACTDEGGGLDAPPQHFDATNEDSVTRFDANRGLIRLERGPTKKIDMDRPPQLIYKSATAPNDTTTPGTKDRFNIKRMVPVKRDGACLFSCVSPNSNSSWETNSGADKSIPHRKQTSNRENDVADCEADCQPICTAGLEQNTEESTLPIGANMSAEKFTNRRSRTNPVSMSLRLSEQCKLDRNKNVVKIANERSRSSAQENSPPSATTYTPHELLNRTETKPVESETTLQERENFTRNNKLRKSLPLTENNLRNSEPLACLREVFRSRSSSSRKTSDAPTDFGSGRDRPLSHCLGDNRDGPPPGVQEKNKICRNIVSNKNDKTFTPFFHTESSEMKFIGVL